MVQRDLPELSLNLNIEMHVDSRAYVDSVTRHAVTDVTGRGVSRELKIEVRRARRWPALAHLKRVGLA